MSTITPNMNLIESTINVDSGLAWETNLNSSLTRIDGHDHSSGNGVQIGSSGLHITSSLSMNGSSLIDIGSLVFTQQASLATLNAIFVGTDGNLYYNDATGGASIQITAGGLVNATSSGISSGSASASFIASVLVVNAAASTPANIQAGSLLIGNNISGSKFLTLAPPASMANSFTVTLPLQPASTKVISISSSGTMATGVAGTVDNTDLGNSSVTTSKIADSNVTTSKIADQNVTQAKKALRASSTTAAVAGGILFTATSGNFSTSNGTYTSTGLSGNLTTLGNPVQLLLVADGLAVAQIRATGSSGMQIAITRNGSNIAETFLSGISYPPGVISFIDNAPAAGTYGYAVVAKVVSGGTVSIIDCCLVAYEI